MKPLFIFLLALTFEACESQISPVYMPGFDFKLFRHTPVSDLANAVEADDSALVQAAIHAEKADLDFQDVKFGNSLLTLAVVNSKLVAAKVLLDSGANPNLRSARYGLTPFLAACRYGYMNKKKIELLRYLIKFGADVNARQIQVDSTHINTTPLANTALEFTIEFGTLETVKLLIDSGAKLDIYPKDGPRSLPFIAALSPRLDVLQFLLIEKRVPIPNYAVVRNKGESNEEKISLKQILLEEGPNNDPIQERERQEILGYLNSQGK